VDVDPHAVVVAPVVEALPDLVVNQSLLLTSLISSRRRWRSALVWGFRVLMGMSVPTLYPEVKQWVKKSF
jgi:hypothetical protein